MSLSRLLVVDDDLNVAAFLEGALRKMRVEVVAARSGEEALERLEQAAPDAIFLDVRLPGMNGLETFAALRERGVDVPVVIVTSHASMETAVEAMKEGAYDFLTKPLRLAPCEALIERLDHDGRPRETGSPSDVSHDRRGRRLIGKSPAMIEVYKTIGRVARTDVTVLITGESGTGKELVARLIHDHGGRREGPWQVVNCAAIPDQLLESELFGHEKGAFTGATERRLGKFEQAHGGTIFLDEIGDMQPALQSKILRALENRVIERVGGNARIPVDVRVIAATNHDLQAAVRRGRFREDLYYRLAVVTIRIPPLRDRREDIRPLADHFLRRFHHDQGRPFPGVAVEVYRRLEEHDWPGNVRELRNVLERALTLSPSPALRSSDLPDLAEPPRGRGVDEHLRAVRRAGLSLADLEREYYRLALEETGWNHTQAAELLGVHRNTVHRKILEHGLEPPAAASPAPSSSPND
jgi:DNA-binding NtrC family response regulator